MFCCEFIRNEVRYILKFIGSDYDNYAHCKVNYFEEDSAYDEIMDNFIVLEDEHLEEYLQYILDFSETNNE